MLVVRSRRLEVVFAAVRTHNRITDFVHGAQVEDEMFLLFDWFAAVLTDKLQPYKQRCSNILHVQVLY